MDYLFDLDDSGRVFHDILGFVDADFSAEQILPYLRRSTKTVVNWIGKENYELALELEDDDEYLILVKYAITLEAFREYMPLMDVSYTTDGRVFRSDDKMKAAFEWMIDNSDEAMERSFYASVNEILNFILDELNADESDYEFTLPKILEKSGKLYVSSISVFQEYQSIDNSHLLFYELLPSLALAERRIIKPRIGDADYKEKPVVLDVIRQICVYFAMIDGLRKNKINLFPRSVLKETKGKAKQTNASQFDVEASVLHYREELDVLKMELEQLVAKDKQKPIKTGDLINFGPEDSFVTL